MSASEGNSEWLTRKRRIDPQLAALGWVKKSAPTAAPFRLEEYETDAGPADYAFGVAEQILAVVEAKKLSLGPQGVLLQAQRYSRGASDTGFNFRGYRVPFLYSTNGEVIWFHDIRNSLNLPRRIAGFHTPAGLQDLLARDFEATADQIAALPNNHPRLRPYQREANEAVEQAIAERKRRMLVAMATGTGKTFTMVNQIYRLMKADVAKRVLFLVDRRALAAQAVRAFKSFEPEPALKFDQIYELYSQRFQSGDMEEEESNNSSNKDKTKFDMTELPHGHLADPKPGTTFVYVCTIQRLAMELFGRQAAEAFGELDGEDFDDLEPNRPKLPIHAFDLIVADECHRGYTSQELSIWRDTLDHFDAIRIGLTATPAKHTVGYFGEPVFEYSYNRAVREGHLVDYDIVKVNSEVRLHGVFLREGEHIDLVDIDSGSRQMHLLEDQRQFDPAELEKAVTSPDSNRKIIQALKEFCDQHQERYGRFPKTLIFAANDLNHRSHADQLVEICQEVFGRGPSFVSKITGRVDRPLQRIREFRNRPQPGIVVSVDLMSTGVDIPNLEVIVFLRPVQSRILWEQMLGRGTRLGDPSLGKTHFTVFDCFGGTLFERFKNASEMGGEMPAPPSRKLREIIEDIYQNRDRAYNVRCLVKRLQRIDKEMSGAARNKFRAFVADGDIGKFAAELPDRIANKFTETLTLLRDANFQHELINYEPRRDPFVIALETRDTITTEWFLRDAEGRELKPEDYLEMFSRFVRENPAQINAIQILLDKPKEWGPQALSELKAKLSETKERFTPEMLEKAHQVHYKKALVDIISMVKHAARADQPLLTAEERVNRAFDKLTAGKQFTAAQQAWLDRIREHLVQNLSIDRDDFDDLPVFARYGGWSAADREFEGNLVELLREINTAVAA
jgi:type I restriction enzyme R subunit